MGVLDVLLQHATSNKRLATSDLRLETDENQTELLTIRSWRFGD